MAPAEGPTPKALTFMGGEEGGAALILTLVPHYCSWASFIVYKYLRKYAEKHIYRHPGLGPGLAMGRDIYIYIYGHFYFVSWSNPVSQIHHGQFFVYRGV